MLRGHKKLTYQEAYTVVIAHLAQIGRGNLIAFCKENKINYNVIRNLKSDVQTEYPKLVLKLLNIFSPQYTQQTEYLYLKTPLKKNSNEKTRSIKSRNGPAKK